MQESLRSKSRIGEKSCFFVLVLIVASILLLPIYKGGYRATPTSLFLVASALIVLLIPNFLDLKEKLPWLTIWGLVSLAIFLKPLSIWPSSLNGTELQSQPDLADFYTWSFFTGTWFIALVISELKQSALKWVFMAIFISSLFQAVFGLFHFLGDYSSVLGLWEKEFYPNSATGTFINRNIYAGMLALSWPISVLALVSGQLPYLSRAPRLLLIASSVVYSIFILAALISSQSRMGLTAAMIGIVAFFIIYTRGLESNNQLTKVVSAKYFPLTILSLFLLFLVWFGIGDIGERYSSLDGGDGRFEIWKSLFSLPIDVWLKGIGPGAFNDVFNQVRPSHMRVEMRYAHNDYLQFILQFGLIWSLVILTFFVWFMFKCLPRGAWLARSGALATLLVLAIHSLVDCVLQIPGAAIVAWSAFGVVMNKRLAKNREESQLSTPQTISNTVRHERRNRKKSRKKQGGLSKKQKWIAYFRSD